MGTHCLSPLNSGQLLSLAGGREVSALSPHCPLPCLGSCFTLSPSLPCPRLSFNSQFPSPSSLSRPCPCLVTVPASSLSLPRPHPHLTSPSLPVLYPCLSAPLPALALAPGDPRNLFRGLSCGDRGEPGPGSAPRAPHPLPGRSACGRAGAGSGGAERAGRSYLRRGEQSLQNRDLFEKSRDASRAGRRSPAATGKCLLERETENTGIDTHIHIE